MSPCETNDQTCFEKNANILKLIVFAGIPEHGVKSSDRLFVKEMEADLTVFKYKVFNSTLVGLSNCEITNWKRKENLTEFECDLNCPELFFSGKYKMSRQLVSRAVEEHGDLKLITEKYLMHIKANIQKVDVSDGKTHVAIQNFKQKCVPLSAITFDFKNVFSGQNDLSDEFHKFVPENWRKVAELAQDPICEANFEEVFKNVNEFLKIAPVEDFILN